MLHLYNTKIIRKTIVFSIFILFASCSFINKDSNVSETENQSKILKKKRTNNNVIERADQNAERGMTLFGNKKKDQLGNNNIMWQATLETLDEFPISYASFSGAIISTDWYSNNESNESIKIEIRFLANEISPRSIKVNSFKKKCVNANCKVTKMREDFNKKILDEIVKKVTSLNIEKEIN